MQVTEKNNYRYFLFSSSQYKERVEVEQKMGKKFIPGVVYYKGKRYQFTEITDQPSKCRFADYRVVAEGHLDQIKYNPPAHVWG